MRKSREEARGSKGDNCPRRLPPSSPPSPTICIDIGAEALLAPARGLETETVKVSWDVRAGSEPHVYDRRQAKSLPA